LDEHKKVLTEVDILLVNTEWTMAVEVKREPDMDDVRHHLKRMKLLRKYSYALVRGKKLVGAIAGGEVSPAVRDYAQKSGLYVLELNGEQVSLVESPPGFAALEC
jgi:RecB family endonuclease NucS